MKTVRVAKETDREAFYRLWKICFGDSDSFCDWFFANRFAPDYSVVLEKDGEIVSCMQAFPYKLWIRGRAVQGAMLCGVSTHPDHRKKGYMRQVFTYAVNHLRQKGCIVLPHTPAVLSEYFPFGHFPVADAAYLEYACVPPMKEVCGIRREEKDWDRLFLLYERVAKQYSGMILRTKDDFLLKVADYLADGGECLVYTVHNEIKGYAFYYRTEKEMICPEVLAEEWAYPTLLRGLLHQADGLSFSAKLPPETELPVLRKRQKGVMGLCDASALLRSLQLEIPYAFRLTDTVVSQNNGVFDFRGQFSAEQPVFEISAGHLMQALVGYRTLSECSGEIKIFEEEHFRQIDAFLPKQHCYIIDEY